MNDRSAPDASADESHTPAPQVDWHPVCGAPLWDYDAFKATADMKLPSRPATDAEQRIAMLLVGVIICAASASIGVALMALVTWIL